jgi:hypothetical protein
MSEAEAETEKVELFMEGVQILLTEFGKRLPMEEMANCFLSVGYDMMHHIAEESMPGETPENISDSIEEYSRIIINQLKEDVWNRA